MNPALLAVVVPALVELAKLYLAASGKEEITFTKDRLRSPRDILAEMGIDIDALETKSG